MYAYYGTYWSETLRASNWDYNWNAFYMGAGDDTVITPSTGVAYRFAGGTGNDYFTGDTASDIAYGDADHDTLNGWGGNDALYGGSGRDRVSGGDGVDHLFGGADGDYLFGGTSYDYFHVARGESNAVIGQADTIYDWDVRYDYVDSSIRGTSSNYGEMMTTANNIETARSIVEGSGLRHGDHAFLYNGANDTGYLLSDLDRNYTFETGVVIRGAGSSTDMNWSDII